MQKVRLIIIALLILLPLCTSAQGRRVLHYDCLKGAPLSSSEGDTTPRIKGNEAPSGTVVGASGAAAPRRPLTLQTQWDAERTYPILVILVEFADKAFSCEDPVDRYNRMLNEEGYNEGVGPGCLTEYFVEQSGGFFHPRFDVYGPIAISANCSGNGQYGTSAFRSALLQAGELEGIDFSEYDWNGDGRGEYVVFVHAGYGGNETETQGKGYIWPSTGSFSSLTLGGITFTGYSGSAELWSNDTSCGIGTIAHEFSHTLGLPDIYPTSGSEYSVCDEWDLMDGGNYANDGWCPPCYTAHERMLLGWLTPVELAESITINNLKPLADDGVAYIINTESANEFFLLENRQWSGWDARTPGHGLLISHVDYNASAWQNNRVNTNRTHHRYELVHADNRDYNAWDSIVGKGSTHLGGHSLLLSGTAYPFVNDSTENRDFTDFSEPAATTFSGTELLSKPITDIEEDADGSISFHFMGGDTNGIDGIEQLSQQDDRCYDLHGRRVPASYRGLVIKNGKLFNSHYIINKHNPSYESYY